MNGKGSARRAGVMPEGAWERIFNKEPAVIEDEPPRTPCDCHGAGCWICNPTDDGPGQENEEVAMERET